MTRLWSVPATVAIVLASLIYSSAASACPFCPQVAKTFSEEFETSDVVVIAKLLKPPAPPALTDSGSVDQAAIAKFEVVDTLKGSEHMKQGATIATAYFGDGKTGQQFLLMGSDPQEILWTTPLPASDRAVAYFRKLKELPEEGAERLAYFQKYLEDSDDMLARDAFDEFARAPYESVQNLAPQMNHDQLVAWIHDIDIPASRRRLYLTMLGTCGSESDLPMLESMLRSDDRKLKAGLDAMIACYLTLGGPSHLPLIESLFLESKEAEYADTYAAIMALRFHGSQAEVIPKNDLVEAMRLMLERPQLADLVIPDLAQWEDWESMDKIVSLFKTADDKSNFVRVPAINFLRACPLPEAKEHLQEMEKIDPKAFKRANTFFPGGAKQEEEPAQSSSTQPGEETRHLAAKPVTEPPLRREQAAGSMAATADSPQLASISRATLRKEPDLELNHWQIASVLLGGGLGLGLVMWGLLRSHATSRP